MKKLILILAMVFMSVMAFAQVRTFPNPDGTVNVEWDAPANVQSAVIPAAEVSYEIYVGATLTVIANPENISSFILIGTTDTLTFDNVDVSLALSPTVDIGVRAVWANPMRGDVYSNMLWSSVGGAPVPFIVEYDESWLIEIDPPFGIRLK